MMKSLACCAAMLLLSGCASPEKFRTAMDAHIGQSIESIKDELGYHFVEKPLDGNNGGAKSLTWRWSQTTYSPVLYPSLHISRGWRRGHSAHYGMFYAFPSWSVPERRECELTFLVSRQRIVTAWHARGSGCVYYRPKPVMRSTPSAG